MQKHPRYPVLPILLICFLFTFACQQATPEQATEAFEHPTEIPASPVPPTETTPPQQQASNSCVDCHADKQNLIDTAKPEELVLSENAGEG